MGKEKDSNYDGNCTAFLCLSGTYEISRRWIFVGLSLHRPLFYLGNLQKAEMVRVLMSRDTSRDMTSQCVALVCRDHLGRCILSGLCRSRELGARWALCGSVSDRLVLPTCRLDTLCTAALNECISVHSVVNCVIAIFKFVLCRWFFFFISQRKFSMCIFGICNYF